MEISKIYNPSVVEEKWYRYWTEHNFFHSVPDDREPYTIVIPPPNVTGVLHMGHMLNNTIQDVLIRRARMQGKNACWVPGTDHASIATEAKVVAMLRERGIKKSELTRNEFLKYAWEWKEKYGGIILEQLKKLGASCDWQRTRFTMDEKYYEEVIDVFIDLFEKGYIYRGLRMVNWDPVAKTAVSDEEVIFKEINSKLLYVKYFLAPEYEAASDQKNYLTVATVRPETIMGDVAVAVHPRDDRYLHWHGKHVIVPLVNRRVPVITDEAIDREFGTGCLKITPAHDALDYEIGLRNNLPVIDVLNEDGTISSAGEVFIGMDRFASRKAALKKLEEDQLIEKSEDYKHQVGHSERTDAVIEPRLSMQWFLKMKELSQPALDAVINGEVNLIPPKFTATYRHWMENLRDWCLSRQLWWGHRIPAWYDKEGNFAVAKNREEALVKLKAKNPVINPEELVQDEDVLDTWASSWLWPISVFDGISDPDNRDIKYYYPTSDLITAPEILFFWVARMIISGYEYRKKKPFQNVYLTGIVRDRLGRKMSKSLGNSPEPLELIAKFSADGVRIGMLLCSPAGNDLLFDESYCEQGRNFANKIWNAFRLIHGWKTDDIEPSGKNQVAVDWFNARLSAEIKNINALFSKYRISEALMSTYKLMWDDFCSWYLEIIKPEFTESGPLPLDQYTYNSTIEFFEDLLKLLHPFMPFITEELWHLIRERSPSDCLLVADWCKSSETDEELLSGFDLAAGIIGQIRNLRKEKNISPKETLQLFVRRGESFADQFEEIIKKLGGISELIKSDELLAGAANFMVNDLEFSVPVGDKIDLNSEKKKLQSEIEYNRGFLDSVLKKLQNKNFIAKARPEVVAAEEKKKSDAELKIKILEQQLEQLE